MSDFDLLIYKSILTLLKNGEKINISKIAREASVARATVYRKIEKYTFQDLTKKLI